MDHNKLWKILQELGLPDHLTCLPRKLYAYQEATVRIKHGTLDTLFLFLIDVTDDHLFKEIVVGIYFMIIWVSE